MNLHLVARESNYDGCFGILRDDQARDVCVTAEHAYLIDGVWKPKLPAGDYTVVRYHSPHFGYDLFLIQDVPGHDHIEIHIGNYPQKDSDGCILVGHSVDHFETAAPDSRVLVHQRMVTHSGEMFKLLMHIQEGVNEFKLTVRDEGQA